jgi:hypothetical protein
MVILQFLLAQGKKGINQEKRRLSYDNKAERQGEKSAVSHFKHNVLFVQIRE